MRRTYTSQIDGRPIEVDDDDAYDAWKDGEINYRDETWEANREANRERDRYQRRR